MKKFKIVSIIIGVILLFWVALMQGVWAL